MNKGEHSLDNMKRREPGEIEFRIYAATAAAPRKIMVVPVPLPPIMGFSLPPPMWPLAIDPTGRRLAIEKYDMHPENSRGIGSYRRLQIIDLQDTKPNRDLVAEQWTPPHPTDVSMMLKTTKVVFSGDGRSLAVRQTEPECPPTKVTNPMTLMPELRPSCPGVPGLKISFKVWDLETGLQLSTLENVTQSGPNAVSLTMPQSTNLEPMRDIAASAWATRTGSEQKHGGSDGQTKASDAKTGTANISDGSRTRTYRDWLGQTATQAIPKEIERLYGLLVLQPQSMGFAPGGSDFALDSKGEIVETRAQFDTASGSILVTHRLSLSADSLIEEACLRMEAEERVFSPEEWRSQFPGAIFHPICPSASGHL